MRIETAIQESKPKDRSDRSKKRIEREKSRIISVGRDAPIKHARILVQTFGITPEEIFG